MLTLAELRVGALLARDQGARAIRLRTLTEAQAFDPLPVDERVSEAFAEIAAHARGSGHRLNIIDALIGATARASDLPVFTQDTDFETMPGVQVELV